MKKILLGSMLLAFSAHSFAIGCHGTEPFWTVEISEEKMNLATVTTEDSTIVTNVTAPAGMPNTNDGYVRIFSNSRGPVATLISNKCNDGMSPFIYPKSIIIFTPTGSLYGCCGEGRD